MLFPSSTKSPRRGVGCCLLLGGLLTLSACDLGPDYRRPDVPPPAAWHTSGEAAAAWPSSEWWQGFGSAQLDAYIVQAQRANDDIAAAVARVRQADAQARIAGAPLLPAVQGSFDASQQRTASSTTGAFATGPSFSPLLSASYELDFWGKNRAALNAAKAAAQASRYDQATVELTVMSSVATTYFQVLELRDRAAIAQDNYDTAQNILDGLQKQEAAGIANALDVAQQASTTAALYAAIPPLRQQLQQSIDALAILLGASPESLAVDSGTLGDLRHPEVAPGLPSELLRRRPDVAEAEAKLISANYDVAVARANFFPSITLTASGGYASKQLAGLFNPANGIFSIAAGLTQPIFEGGQLQGQSELAKGQYAELLADYHKSVISAFGNVEDALAALQQTTEQEKREQQAVEAAQRAYKFAQAQMHAGTINVLTLLSTESALFSAQDALAQVQYSHLQALVSLYNALGGGWQQA